MGFAAFADDECPDPARVVADAEQLVLFADLDGARAALLRVESALGCGGPADPIVLAHLWLVEGALLMDSGASSGAATSFAAARRVAPTVWIEGLGPERRKAYEAVAPVTGIGQLAIDAPLGTSGTAWVDGVPEVSPVSVRPGEHLVQYGANGRAWFARIVLVSDEQLLHIAVPPPPAPAHLPMDPNDAIADQVLHVVATPQPVVVLERPEVVETRAPSTRAYPHLAVGTDLAFGGTVGDVFHSRKTDPGTVLTAPLELGGGASGKRLWARGVVSIAPLFAGELPYEDTSGDAQVSPFAAGAHVATGVSFGPLDVGLLGGFTWPGRTVGRFVVGLAIPGAPLEIEARVGANLRSDQPFEPAASLAFVFPGLPAGGWRN